MAKPAPTAKVTGVSGTLALGQDATATIEVTKPPKTGQSYWAHLLGYDGTNKVLEAYHGPLELGTNTEVFRLGPTPSWNEGPLEGRVEVSVHSNGSFTPLKDSGFDFDIAG